MRIAVDAMGGDYAPGEIVKGAVEAVVEDDIQIILVGNVERVRNELKKYRFPSASIMLVDAHDNIDMNEHPVAAVRRKRNSSLVMATRLVKEGRAEAIVSAGNTGAQMAAALFEFGRIPGVERPGIATVFPTPKGPKILIDSGANVDTKARHLLHFAYLGSFYAQEVMGINNPGVALLNVGSEPNKGNEIVLEAYRLLASAKNIRFIGNIEGRDFFTGSADVVVCDGFVGNIVLKLTEGMVETLFDMIKGELRRSPIRLIGGLLAKSAFRTLAQKLDYAEYGGAPLLGVQGISIICHGSSRSKAIKNAIHYARDAVQKNFIESVMKGFVVNCHEQQ